MNECKLRCVLFTGLRNDETEYVSKAYAHDTMLINTVHTSSASAYGDQRTYDCVKYMKIFVYQTVEIVLGLVSSTSTSGL